MSESVAKLGNLSQERLSQYEQLCKGKPDALCVLAGGLVQRSSEVAHRSGSYADVDSVHGLLSGAKARIIATVELQKYFPDVMVIANSNVAEEGASYARVATSELQRAGIEDEKILIQENSYSLFTELIEMVRLIIKNKWSHVAVITNEFQIGRAQAMFEKIDELHDPNGYWQRPEVLEAMEAFKRLQPSPVITFVSAEEILPIRNRRYKALIEEARLLPQWKERAEREQNGEKLVRSGEYWKNPPSTVIKR